jgi:hypothetical protein
LWDQESTTWAARSGPTHGLLEQLRCELLGQRLDLASELPFLDDQLPHAPGDGAEREQRAPQLRVLASVRSGRREPVEQPGWRHRVRPAPYEPVPSTANARRPGAYVSATASASA